MCYAVRYRAYDIVCCAAYTVFHFACRTLGYVTVCVAACVACCVGVYFVSCGIYISVCWVTLCVVCCGVVHSILRVMSHHGACVVQYNARFAMVYAVLCVDGMCSMWCVLVCDISSVVMCGVLWVVLYSIMLTCVVGVLHYYMRWCVRCCVCCVLKCLMCYACYHIVYGVL